ncbi:hypothetical protein [Streptacidiphilus rugosus]|uniref:hypothetical protein n=1 Tax=Streptacidiphilus rugosus TaxID=405783 RepID=UPI000A499BB0|nr:hypothetical protein [Streptacidiphilus rugosus]
MSDSTPAPRGHGSEHHAHVVVVHHPVDATPPFRRVDILGTEVGKAHSFRDVVEFCRRAGLDESDLESQDLIEWIGGGPDIWE